jgi:hypothetical protein
MEKGAVMSIIINLEKEKLRLGGQISRDKRSVEELGKVVEALQANVLAQRAKLGAYNALFMRMSDADVKAPRQRLGAREAVLGTKRIINRELERLENEVVVAEMKLNRSRERNQGIREKINQLRREHVTYRHLFEKMRGELGELKQGIALVDRAVDSEYSQRDRAYGEMRELAKQFEVDKLERLQAFQQVTEELEAIPLGVAPQESVMSKTPKSHTSSAMDPAAGGGAGGGGGGEDALRKRVAKAQQKLTKDRYAIEQAHRKLGTFSTALRRIKASTGYARTAEVSAIFNRYEEEKFAKAQLAQRLMDEIEALEGSVAAMHSELTTREGENAALKAQRSAAVETLTRAAREHEAELAETSGAVQAAVGDVRSLYRVIEFAFYALGIRSAMDEVTGKAFVAPGSPHGGSGSEAGAFSVPSSPLRAGYGGEGGGFDGAASHLGSSRGPSPLRTGSVSPAAFGAGGGGGGGLRMLSLSRGAIMASPDGGGGLTSVGSAAGGGGSGGSGGGGHGMVRRQRSMSMYAGDARTRHAVRSGVSASSLGAFMGTIENKSAEVIQQYAAVMTRIASGDLSLAHMRFAAGAGGALAEGSDENREEEEDGEGEDGEGGHDPEFAAAAAAMQARRQMQSFAAGSGEAARRLLQSPSVLGPSNPPGRVKESIAASALMASLAVDSARMAGEMDGPAAGGGGGGHGSGASQAGFSHALGSGYGGSGGGAGVLGVEDDSRLLSVAELKAQAMRRLTTDRSIQALKSAAAAAANVLVGNGGGGMPGGLSGSGAAGGGKSRAGSNGGR